MYCFMSNLDNNPIIKSDTYFKMGEKANYLKIKLKQIVYWNIKLPLPRYLQDEFEY